MKAPIQRCIGETIAGGDPLVTDLDDSDRMGAGNRFTTAYTDGKEIR